MKRKLYVAKWVRSLDKWVSDVSIREQLVELPSHNTQELLRRQQLTPNDLYLIGNNVRFMGIWLTKHGAWRIVQNDASGWTEIWDGMRLIGMAEVLCSRTTQATILAANAALALSFFVAMPDSAEATRLARSFTEGRFSGYSQIGFETFILRLYAIAANVAPPTYQGLNPEYGDKYRSILENWNFLTSLESDLVAACDAHVQFALGRRDDYPQFNEPFDLCALEIIAVQRVRQRLGLPVPKVDHPLMDTPLSQIPDNIMPPAPNPVFLKIIERSRELFPSL